MEDGGARRGKERAGDKGYITWATDVFSAFDTNSVTSGNARCWLT